ncbi:MAG: tagatose 1,6-diphosphate aldolase [Truepera sp.]|nr:tagatose 1,6-diphosphate aldolase [Truepera sp.]
MPTLTIGKWNGLKRTSNEAGTFSIVAFDQRDSYRQMLASKTTYREAVKIKQAVVEALSPYASAFLLDPEYGLEPALYLHRTSGLILAVEKSGYSGDATYRRTELYAHWNVAKIKLAGAQAVKLLVYYHPKAGALANEIESLSADIAEQCRNHDLCYFLEPLIYSLDPRLPKASPEFARQRPELICETATRLAATGPDVLKLEFPVDVTFDPDQSRWRDACAALSEASPVPWVLLSAGVEFELFKQQLELACAAGASGFLAGRAIWQEGVSMSPESRQTFLTKTAVPRLHQLTEIVNAHARPWTAFFSPAPLGEESAFAKYGAYSGFHK